MRWKASGARHGCEQPADGDRGTRRAARAGSRPDSRRAGSRRSSPDGRGRGLRSSSRITRSSSGIVCGTRSTADQPPSARSTWQAAVVARCASAPGSSAPRDGGSAAGRHCRPRGAASPLPARACRQTDTCRQSARVAPSRHAAPFPDRCSAIHPSFTCGRPIDFDSPPRLTVSTSACSTTLREAPGAGSIGIVGKHLVADERQVVRRAQVDEGRQLVALEPAPRRVVRAHHEHRSRRVGDRVRAGPPDRSCHAPWYSAR